MLKTYIIHKGKSKKEFQTIKIPRGTILFRGLSFENKNNYCSLFNDLIGIRDGPRYKIAPTMNVFFYPVPYVSDVVNVYNIHTMYITQYNIELIMLVSPSLISRGNKDIIDPTLSPITTCSRISEFDKCGYKMSDDDPCVTEIILKRFPHIDGYIGLAGQDIALINKKYKDIIDKTGNIDIIKQIIPSIITNSRGLSGIPEIVIHPLRFRHDECHILKKQFRNSGDIVKYCILYRAQYNFFPLLYFTNNGIFTFNDLKDDDTIDLIAKSVRLYDPVIIPKVYQNINKIFSKMLTEDGYKINNIIYRVFIDRRTGFYRASNKLLDLEEIINKRSTYKKMVTKSIDNVNHLDSYIIKPNNSEINTILSTYKEYIDKYLLENCYMNGYSLKKKLVFDRKNKNKFVYNYYIDKMSDRPDLEKYSIIREKNKNITRKKINSDFSTGLKLDGFIPNNIDNVSSVDSLDIL